FVLMAVLAVVLAVAVWLRVPADRAPADTRAHWLREMLDAYGALGRLPAFRAYVAILRMGTGSFYVFLAAAPSGLASYGVGPATVGWFIMFIPLAYIAGNFLTSRLISRAGDNALMFLGHGTAIAGITLALLLAVAGVHSPFALAGPLLLLGLGHGLMM